VRQFGEQIVQGNAEVASSENAAAIHPFRFACGMILPCGLFFRIDHPAERDAPGVILLAFGEHGADTVFWRKDLYAQEHGLGGVRSLKGSVRNHVRDEVFGRCEPDGHFGKRLDALPVEERHQDFLNQTVKRGGHCFGVKYAVDVLTVGFPGAAEVVFDGDYCGSAHILFLL